MQMRDILWAVSLPFRIYNTKELGINLFTFTLSFDAALPKCNVSTARRLLALALEKGWIEREANILRAKFELWQPKFFPPEWKPNFSNIGNSPMVDLIPLETNIQYIPKTIERKKPKHIERGPFYSSKSIKDEKKGKITELKETVEKRELSEKIKVKKPKITAKEKIEKKKGKRKAQKNISDFFS
ncbi:MAG: hypothetical protein ACTSRC_05570 [Candidatus Helarchaeota archaeon]